MALYDRISGSKVTELLRVRFLNFSKIFKLFFKKSGKVKF